MQKVIHVNINARPGDSNNLSEHEAPELNNYLKEGYKVVNVYQIAPSPSLYCTTITFVIEKKQQITSKYQANWALKSIGKFSANWQHNQIIDLAVKINN